MPYQSELAIALDRAALAEGRLRAIDRVAAERHVAESAAAIATREAAEREARNAARAGEIEKVRRAGWHGHVCSNVEQIAAHNFSPSWIDSQIPPSGWAPGDSESAHSYLSPVPISTDDNDPLPPLVALARKNGFPI